MRLVHSNRVRLIPGSHPDNRVVFLTNPSKITLGNPYYPRGYCISFRLLRISECRQAPQPELSGSSRHINDLPVSTRKPSGEADGFKIEEVIHFRLPCCLSRERVGESDTYQEFWKLFGLPEVDAEPKYPHPWVPAGRFPTPSHPVPPN